MALTEDDAVTFDTAGTDTLATPVENTQVAQDTQDEGTVQEEGILTFPEWIKKQDPKSDPLDSLRGFSRYAKTQMLKQGAWDDEEANKIDELLAEKAVNSGLELGEDPVSAIRYNEDDSDIDIVAKHASMTGDEVTREAAMSLRALMSPRVRGYVTDEDEYQQKLTAARESFRTIATPDKVLAARKAAVDDGDIPFAVLNDGKNPRLYMSDEMRMYAGNDEALGRFLENNPQVNPSVIPALRKKLSTPEGYEAPEFVFDRQQDFLASFQKEAATNPDVDGYLRGVAETITQNRPDQTDQAIDRLQTALSGTTLASEFNNPEERKAFIKDLATRVASPNIDEENVDKNVLKLSTGEVVLPRSVMLQKPVFDRIMNESTAIPEAQKKAITAARESTLEEYSDQAFKTINASSRGEEFRRMFQKSKAEGKSNAAILDEWMSNPDNHSSVGDFTVGIGRSVLQALPEIPLGLLALSGNNWSREVLQGWQEADANRRAYADLYGKRLGWEYDLSTLLAPVVADMVISRGILTAAKSSVKTSVKAGLKGALRGYMARQLGEDTASLASRFIKGRATKELVREGAVGVTETSIDDVVRLAGRDFARGLETTAGAAATSIPAFTRSAGSTYVQLYSALEREKNADGSRKFTDEQIREKALDHALVAGGITAALTSGFSLFGMAGAERILSGNLTRTQLNQIHRRTLAQWSKLPEAVRNEIGDVSTPTKLLEGVIRKSLRPLYKSTAIQAGLEELPEEALDSALGEINRQVAMGEKIDPVKAIKEGVYAGALGFGLGGVVGAARGARAAFRGPDATSEDFVRRQSLLQTARKLDESNLPETAAVLRRFAQTGIPQEAPAAPAEGTPAEGTPVQGTAEAGLEQAPSEAGDQQAAGVQGAESVAQIAEQLGLDLGTMERVPTLSEMRATVNSRLDAIDANETLNEQQKQAERDKLMPILGTIEQRMMAETRGVAPAGVAPTAPAGVAPTAPAAPQVLRLGNRPVEILRLGNRPPMESVVADYQMELDQQQKNVANLLKSEKQLRIAPEGESEGQRVRRERRLKRVQGRIRQTRKSISNIRRLISLQIPGTIYGGVVQETAEPIVTQEEFAAAAIESATLPNGKTSPSSQVEIPTPATNAPEIDATGAVSPVEGVAPEGSPEGQAQEGAALREGQDQEVTPEGGVVAPTGEAAAPAMEQMEFPLIDITETFQDPATVVNNRLDKDQASEQSVALDPNSRAAREQAARDMGVLNPEGITDSSLDAIVKGATEEPTQQQVEQAEKVRQKIEEELAKHGDPSTDITAFLKSVAKKGKPIEKFVARLMLNFPEMLATVPITRIHRHAVGFAGANITSANDSKGQILINTARPGPRGAVDTVLHELFHAATEYSIQNPTEAQKKVLDRLDRVRKTIRKAAQRKGLDRLNYATGSMSEFLTHFITSDQFKKDVSDLTPRGQKNWFRVVLEGLRDLVNGKVPGKNDITDEVMRDLLSFTQSIKGTYNPQEQASALFLYAGENADVDPFKKDSLATARTMAAVGKTSAEIRAITGWFPGPDGKMRWEIPDNEASPVSLEQFENAARATYGGVVFNRLSLESAVEKVKKGEVLRLKDILKHDQLFKAYPAAAELPVFPIGGNDGSGSFRIVGGEPFITVNVTTDKGSISNKTVSTLLHEVQHLIQNQEGFSPGGSPDTLITAKDVQDASKFRDAMIALDRYKKSLASLVNEVANEKAKSKNILGFGGPNSKTLANLDKQIKDITDQVNKIWANQNKQIGLKQGSAKEGLLRAINRVEAEFGSAWTLTKRNEGLQKIYRLLAGEVEARDVEARRNLTAEQRAAMEPYTSEDIAFDDMIITEGTYGTPRMDQLMLQPADDQRISRFLELTEDLRGDVTQTEIDAWKNDNPEAYEELKLMRDGVEPLEIHRSGPFAGELVLPNDWDQVRMQPAVTTEQDAEYLRLAADPEANRGILQRMVDAAAKAAGYDTPKVFHGTPRETGFTVFDPTKGRSFGGVNNVGSWWTTNPKQAAAFAEFYDVDKDGRILGTKQGNVYQAYLRTGRLWNAGTLSNFFRVALGRSGKTQLSDIGPAEVETIRGYFRNSNIDSVRIADTKGDDMTGEGAGEYYVTFSPEQIKSADPVTRDNNGNVIPLSQRFQVESPDIRFQPAESVPAEEGGNLPNATWETLMAQGYNPEASEKTQIATTTPTYVKILRAFAKQGMSVLDFAAGRGLGTKAAKEIGDEVGFTVTGFEPYSNPATRAIAPEYEGADAVNDIPNNSQDLIINNAVLNVVPESTGVEILTQIYDKLKPGGSAFVNVMGWNNIKSRLSNPKTRIVGPREIITQKGTFQKGYTPNSLARLIRNTLPDADIQKTPYGDIGFKITKPDIRFQPAVTPDDVDMSGFYSQLERVVTAKIPSRATAQQIMATIDPARGSGVKTEEIKWSGIEQALASLEKDGKVSKDDLLNYLRNEGQVRFEEVSVGERFGFWTPDGRWKEFDSKKEAEQARELEVEWAREEGKGSVYVSKKEGKAYHADFNGDVTVSFEYDNKSKRWVMYDGVMYSDDLWTTKEVEQYLGRRAREDEEYWLNQIGDIEQSQQGGTKYSQYVLPGGENYREVVLAMPRDPLSDKGKRRQFIDQRLYDIKKRAKVLEPLESIDSDAKKEMAKLESEYAELVAERETIPLEESQFTAKYTSSHFPDIPNYVAHMRVNERADAQGKQGLFVEEFQSDRHQAGRKKGYKGETGFNVVKSIGGKGWEAYTTGGEYISGTYKPTEQESREAASRLVDQEAISDAPFRTTWPLQLFKRALRDAVSSGKDWIGWTTGDTQNKRFDLSDQLEYVTHKPKEGYPDGTKQVTIKPIDKQHIDIAVAPSGEIISGVGNAPSLEGKLLDEVVGRELSDKILSGEGVVSGLGEDYMTLQGDNLKMQGLGMKGFYDNMLPKEIGKYVKQWGGKVEKSGLITNDNGPIQIEGSDEIGWAAYDNSGALFAGESKQEVEAWLKKQDTTPIWRVDITPEMRELARTGQAMFQPAVEQPIEDATETDARRLVEAALPEGISIDDLEGIDYQRLAEDIDGAEPANAQDMAHVTVNRSLGLRAGKQAIAADNPTAEEVADTVDVYERTINGSTTASDVATMRTNRPALDRFVKFLRAAANTGMARLRTRWDAKTSSYVDRLSRELARAKAGYRVSNGAMMFDIDNPTSNERFLPTGVLMQPAVNDEQYMRLAANPEANRDELQRRVNAAARAANLIGPWFHGGSMRARGATVASIPSEGFFLAKERLTAESYGKRGSTDPYFFEQKNAFRPTNESHVYAPWVKEWIDFWRSEDGWIDRNTGEEMPDQEVFDMISSVELFYYEADGSGERWHDFLATLKDHHDGFRGYDPTDDSDIAVVFSPEQIKSADPVTYDDEGNVIPLSQRFQATSSDIRFQPATNPEDVTSYTKVQYGNPLLSDTGKVNPSLLRRLFVKTDDLRDPWSLAAKIFKRQKTAGEALIKTLGKEYSRLVVPLMRDGRISKETVNTAFGSTKPLLSVEDEVRIDEEFQARLDAASALVEPEMEQAKRTATNEKRSASTKRRNTVRDAMETATEELKDETFDNQRQRETAIRRRANDIIQSAEREYETTVRQIDATRDAALEVARNRRAIAENEATDLKNKEIVRTEIANAKILRKERDLAIEDIRKVSPEAADHIIKFRKAIDSIQRDYAEKFPDRSLKVDRSLGLYLVRSYEIHQNPGWIEKLKQSPEYADLKERVYVVLKNNVVDREVKRYMRRADTTGLTEDQIRRNAFESMIERRAERLAEDEAYADAPIEDLRKVAEGQFSEEIEQQFEDYLHGHETLKNTPMVNTSIKNEVGRWMKKGNIPEPIRQALGEITDPLFNASRTYLSLAHTVAAQDLMSNMVNSGVENGWMITEAQKLAEPNKYRNWVAIASKDPDSPAYTPLAGYYVEQADRDAFDSVFRAYNKATNSSGSQMMSFFNKMLMGAAGTSLGVVTLGNPGFYSRNILGNMIIAVSQGMNPFSMKTLKAIELARQAAYNIDRGNTQMISELIALGVLKEGVNIGTLRQFADNFQKDPNKFLEIMQGKIAEHSTKAAETFGKARGAAAAASVYAGKPVEFLTNLSEVTETFGKLAIYFNELEVYRKAYTQDNKAAGMTDEEASANAEQMAKQKAAEICNRVYPTKGERIQAIRAFTDSPWSALIAPFAGFKSEMFRTVINTYDVAREQMRSDNPIIQAQGKRRLASAMAVHVAITSVLPVLLSSLAGIDDEEKRSIREAMPSYAKNSNFFFIRDGKNLVSLDATFANPFSLVIDPFTSMGRAIGSGDFSDIPGIVSRTVSDELLGENIAFGRVMDVRRNQDETTGRPIYLPTDTPLDKTMKSMMHVFNGAYNPAIFKKIGDSIDASFRPEQADRTLLEAINYSPTGIMTGMFLPTKPRYHRMDDMTFRAMANLRKANSQLWMYTAEMNSPKPMSPETAAALYEKRVDATQRLRRDMHQVVTGFEKLGMTKGEIIRKMVDAGFSRTSAAMLVNRGLVDRPTLSAESEAEMRQRDPARYAAYLKAKNSYARYFYVGD